MMTGAMPLDDMRDAQEAIHFFFIFSRVVQQICQV